MATRTETKALPIREIAQQLLPLFAENVLAGKVTSYGVYTKAIGRDPSKEAIVIGPAMHAIGGVCVLATVPVAPLYYVRRADGGWRGVFESDPLEARDALPHYDTLYVAAREYQYTPEDFTRIERGLREIVPPEWSAHQIWHKALVWKIPDSNDTFFARALKRYQAIIDDAKATRRRPPAR